MPSIEVTFRNKLSPDQLRDLITKLREIIPEPIVSVDYYEVDYSEHTVSRDKGEVTKTTRIHYRAKR